MSRFTRGLLVVVAGSSLVLAACANDGNDADISQAAGTPSDPRTIEITMRDIEYDPKAVTVAQGETVRFVFTNEGQLPHEATVGDLAEQEEHEAEMAEMGDMAMSEDHDDETPKVSVEPGATGEIVTTFDEAGETIIGCHESGHWDAGMRIDVTVVE